MIDEYVQQLVFELRSTREVRESQERQRLAVLAEAKRSLDVRTQDGRLSRAQALHVYGCLLIAPVIDFDIVATMIDLAVAAATEEKEVQELGGPGMDH